VRLLLLISVCVTVRIKVAAEVFILLLLVHAILVIVPVKTTLSTLRHVLLLESVVKSAPVHIGVVTSLTSSLVVAREKITTLRVLLVVLIVFIAIT